MGSLEHASAHGSRSKIDREEPEEITIDQANKIARDRSFLKRGREDDAQGVNIDPCWCWSHGCHDDLKLSLKLSGLWTQTVLMNMV